eukprot:sb/3469474/
MAGEIPGPTPGACRISTVALVVTFLLSALAYTTYYFAENRPYDNEVESYILIYVFPGLMIMLYFVIAIAYILCILIKPDPIPDEYCLSTEELARFMIQPKTAVQFQTLANLTRQYTKSRPGLVVRERDYKHGGLRICEICSIIKPDRAHHCTLCGRLGSPFILVMKLPQHASAPICNIRGDFVCAGDGSPLSLGEQLHPREKLQVLYPNHFLWLCPGIYYHSSTSNQY